MTKWNTDDAELKNQYFTKNEFLWIKHICIPFLVKSKIKTQSNYLLEFATLLLQSCGLKAKLQGV